MTAEPISLPRPTPWVATLLLALCATTAGAQMSDWQTVVRDRNRSVDLDRASVIDSLGGSKVAWARIVLADSEIAGAGYAMIKALNRFDCEGRRFVTVRRLYLNSEMRVLREEAIDDPTPRAVVRGGVDERLWQAVCRPPSPGDLQSIALAAERAALQENRARSVQAEPSTAQTSSARAPAAATPRAASSQAHAPAPEAPVTTSPPPAPPPEALVMTSPPPPAAPPPAPAPESPATAPRRELPMPVNPLGWQYEGPRGPAHWGKLKPAWKLCNDGRRQSPIDLSEPIRLPLDLPRFDYRGGAFRIEDTGYTLAVQPAGDSQLWLRGERFRLERIEFRMPAEERIDGRIHDMAAELHHRDDQGRMVVVVVPIEAGGTPNQGLGILWGHLPLGVGQALLPSTGWHPTMLLPSSLSYYLYEGSLTVPPCSEGVTRLVLRTPLAISKQQLEVYAQLYPRSARPLQASNGRRILASP